VGVIGCKEKWYSPGLVVLEDDKRTISLLGRNWSHVLPRAASEIEHVSVSPAAPHIAYSTVQGEVVVYSVEHEALLLNLAPVDEP